MKKEWNTFVPGVWQREINVRDFIQKNYTPYDGDDQFLEGPTQNTTDLWEQVMDLSRHCFRFDSFHQLQLLNSFLQSALIDL